MKVGTWKLNGQDEDVSKKKGELMVCFVWLALLEGML